MQFWIIGGGCYLLILAAIILFMRGAAKSNRDEENLDSMLTEGGGFPFMSDVQATLNERGSRYGEFKTHAEITQAIKDSMKFDTNWSALSDSQKEALEMIAHKIGRILNGDPNYVDSWHDISGYATLVENELNSMVNIHE